MKSTLKFSLIVVLLAFFSFSATAVTTTTNTEQDVFVKMMSQLTPDQIINLSRKEIETVIGDKLTIMERGGLLLGKLKMQKLLRKGYSNEAISSQMRRGGFEFKLWAFVLGFFIPLFGTIIAWIVWGKQGFKSALLGFAFSLVLVVIGWRAF